MFGLTKREQYWEAKERAARLGVQLATIVVNARAQVAIAEAQAVAARITADEVRAIVREELRKALAELGGKA